MKKDAPLISVIIPVYNASQFILNTLGSLETQSYQHYEIVLVNDGSTDSSMDILNDYKSQNNNVILYDQENRGVSVARNKGIELATGEFVCFLDSDDTYDPTFLEKMISRQIEKNADLVYCGFNRVEISGKLVAIPNCFREGNILGSYLQKKGYFHFSGILIRKKILLSKSIRFEVGRNISEDLLFTVKLLCNVESYCVKEYLFNYMQRSGSVMSSTWLKDKWLSDINGRKEILSYLMEYYDKNDKQDILMLAELLILQREISYLIDCIKKMHYREIKEYIREMDFCDKENLIENQQYNAKDRKKFEVIKKDNSLIWFLYTLYYRFFRFNLKHF